MRAILLLAALLAPQEESPVGALLGKIDEKDPRASFRALSAMASLGPEHRKALEAGAARLPEFYREALLSELKTRDVLGDHFGKEIRFTAKAGSLAATQHLTEIEKQTGMKVEPGHWLRRGPGESFEMEAGEKNVLEALADVCVKAKHTPYIYGNGGIVLNQNQTEVKPFCYRNFALFVSGASMWKKSDFSGASPWRLQISCTPISDPGVRAASWKPEFRLIDALTDKGEKLEAGPKDAPPALRHTDEPVTKRTLNRWGGIQIQLKIPDKSPEKVARIRGVATALVAKSVREYSMSTFTPLEKARAEDEDFEVALVDTEGGNQYQPEIVVSIRPKKMKLEELSDLPVRVDLKYKGLGDGQSWNEMKVTEKAVEYRIRWWPFDYGRFGAREQRPELESLKISVPQSFVERPVYVELSDISLK